MHKLLAILAAVSWVTAVHAQEADLIVSNAKIVTLDPASKIAQALAVRDGKIIGVDSNEAVEALAGPSTHRIDAGGRTVIPGLIDSHIHAVRAGLTYATEVNWIGAKTIDEAMDRLRKAAKARPGAWIIVAGGWSDLQFAERRRPTLTEVLAAVPDNPTYIQLFYSAVLLTPKAQEALGIATDRLPPGIVTERAASGDASGWLTGTIVSISALFDRLPKPTFEDNVAGTRQFFTELNRLGITGVVDPGGFSVYPSSYAALLKIWREKSLTVRVRFSLFAQNIGSEFEEYKTLTQFLPMGFGDDLLRFNGIGERITGAMYNNNAPDAAAKEKFLEIIRWAAKQGLSVTIHWPEDKSVQQLLDLYDQVNKETPLAPLRWSIAHLDNASPETIKRMQALGIGWTMQDAMYLGGDRMAAQAGEAARQMPPIVTALRAGLHVGAGTDAHRVASYNPFVGLQWMLDGKTVGGLATRGPDETPSREDALRMYTTGSAWFCFDEARRGTIEPGKLADFAVLNQDFMSVPIDQIGGTESLLTVVGGRTVYATSAFAKNK